MSYPLEGLKVLDMSRVLAGPFAGRMLSDLGADVVKLEPPEGDMTRRWGARVNGIAGYFQQQNVGKRDVCVDLRKPAGAELIKALAGKADALIENFRPGVMDRLGVGYDALAAVNPALVMLSISGFGHDSPERGRAAYAPIVHAESGLIERQGRASRAGAADLAVSIADTNASLHGLVALLSALLMRDRTGRGQHIDLAMIDATLATDDHLNYYLEDAGMARPLGSEVWETAGGPVLISGDLRHVWRQLVAVFGIEDPTPEGAPLEDKIRLRREAAARFFVERGSREAVIEALDRMNLAWGDVRTSHTATELPSIVHRGMIAEVDDRAGGRRPVVQSPYRYSDAASGVRGGAPFRGEHNREVLSDWLGWDEAKSRGLEADGVLLAGE